MGAALGVLPDDLRERVMLGDTGANVLGGVLGLVVVLECSRTTRNVIFVVLIALNLLSEFVSFSRVIETGAAAALVRPARPAARWRHLTLRHSTSGECGRRSSGR